MTTHAAYLYDGVNLVTKKTLGTSTAVDLEVYYDNAYRSTKYDWRKSAATLVGFTYGYSAAGNKNYEEKLHDTDKSSYYLYDGVYRLTAWDRGTLNGTKTGIEGAPNYYQDFDLDGLGNWTRYYDNTGTPEYRDPNVMNEYDYIGASAPPQSANLTHDDNGNLTDDGTYEYEWDALNRLIKVLKKDEPDFTVGEYAYDALNRRIWREADEDNDESTDADLMYFYDGWQVVEERDYSDEGLLRDCVYGAVYIDEPIYGRSDDNDDGDFLDTDEKFYYTSNNLYCVAALLDTSGDIIETYEYTPYGKANIYTEDGNDDTWFTIDDTPGSLTGNFYLFTGRRRDPEADLDYFRYRYYSAELGRFVSRDPMEYWAGMNLYAAYFVPEGVDPLGLKVQWRPKWWPKGLNPFGIGWPNWANPYKGFYGITPKLVSMAECLIQLAQFAKKCRDEMPKYDPCVYPDYADYLLKHKEHVKKCTEKQSALRKSLPECQLFTMPEVWSSD